MCTPAFEHGLGIQSLDYIKAGLHANLMWIVLLNQSLWAKVIRAKYFSGRQILVPHTASLLWRMIASHFEAPPPVGWSNPAIEGFG